MKHPAIEKLEIEVIFERLEELEKRIEELEKKENDK